MDEDNPVKASVDRGLRITVNLEGSSPDEVIAYKARKHAPSIELDRINYYAPEEFWEARRHGNNQRLILEPGDFYILASKERVRVPPEFAAEMVPFDPSWASFEFTMPVFSTLASDTVRATSRAHARCWKYGLMKCRF